MRQPIIGVPSGKCCVAARSNGPSLLLRLCPLRNCGPFFSLIGRVVDLRVVVNFPEFEDRSMYSPDVALGFDDSYFRIEDRASHEPL
jgi:hypothetical protein